MSRDNRSSSRSDNRRVMGLLKAHIFIVVMMLGQLMLVNGARAVEVLTVHELVMHCKRMDADPDGADAQYCVRYIQGFIDGAVVTDVRVMLSAEAENDRKETFTERAIRTRAPSQADRIRAQRLAGFCLGDPVPLRDVVNQVVADLAELDVGDVSESPARESVYKSLQEHYSCVVE